MASENEIRILLIEDDRLDAELVEEMLERRLAQTFHIVFADHLSEGLTRLADEVFDVVLIDLSLPDSFGLRTFQKVHEATDLPIIVISGMNEEAEAVIAVREGADDYLMKEELTADSLVRSITFSFERAKHREVERDLARANEQFRIVEQIQQHLVPILDRTVLGFDIAGTVYPAEIASGDYCDFIPMLDETWLVVVADVSGHGLGASHLMLETRAAIRALASLNISVADIINRLNKLLHDDCHTTGHFVTLFMVHLDPANRSYQFAAAGHRAYLMKATGEFVWLNATGPPAGLIPRTFIMPSPVATLETGDLLLLPTDGITESQSVNSSLFGLDRLRETVEAHRRQSAREIVDTLYRAAREFVEPKKQQDDITAVVIKAIQ